jgi:hypothetical protein
MDKRKVNNYLQTLHRKLKIEQHESHYKQRVNSGARGGLAVPAPLVNPFLHIRIPLRFLVSVVIANFMNFL